MMLFFGGFALLWVVVFLSGFVSFALNIWMTVDSVKRFKEDTGRMLLYLLLIWFIPFGGVIYYFVAVPEPERFLMKSLGRHKGKLVVVGSILLIIAVAVSIVVVGAVNSARKVWDVRKAEVEKQLIKAEQFRLQVESDQKKFNQNFEEMEDSVTKFGQDTNQKIARNKVWAVCVDNFYSGVTCKNSIPKAVKDSALKELNMTDEDQIKEVCGCASQDSIDNFYQGR